MSIKDIASLGKMLGQFLARFSDCFARVEGRVWRKAKTADLVSRQCTLIVARNVLTDEVKYFLSNRVPRRRGWTLRRILRVAFGRWPVEGCFREAKEELGLDHFECRG